MSIFAISDLHLSFRNPKPMDIFGTDWKNHPQTIARNWDETVSQEDIVLISGDTSWAMKFEDAVPDLDFIAERPGRKILIRGNHDYWWGRQVTNKIQRQIDPSITLIQGTNIVLDGIGIAGTRGWRLEEGDHDGSESDSRISQRELAYLDRALSTLPEDVHTKIVMLHYPPFNVRLEPNEFRNILDKYSVDIVVYGHVHKGTGLYLEGDVDGIKYYLASADHINFAPLRII